MESQENEISIEKSLFQLEWVEGNADMLSHLGP